MPRVFYVRTHVVGIDDDLGRHPVTRGVIVIEVIGICDMFEREMPLGAITGLFL